MATIAATLVGLGVFYFWLRGWWFVGVALAVAWSLFAGATCTLPQFAFILLVSFAPFLGRLAWRRRVTIYNLYAEANRRHLRT